MALYGIFSNQEMLLSNLKSVATLQYKPEGLHVLFYMTTTKATHMQDKRKRQMIRPWSWPEQRYQFQCLHYNITMHDEVMQCYSFTKDKDTCFLLLTNVFSSVNVTNQTSTLMEQACCPEWGSWMTSAAIATCTCTGVVHNFCNPHGLLAAEVLMHWYTCKCPLNILKRAVEQLAGCLSKETKVSCKRSITFVMLRKEI